MVPPKLKGKDSTLVLWPTHANLHNANPENSTFRPSLSQPVFAHPRTTQDGAPTRNPLPLAEGHSRKENNSSHTWTSSGENQDELLEEDREDGRERFIFEYNRLAQRHGVRPLIPADFPSIGGCRNDSLGSRRSSWFSKMLRQASEQSEESTARSDGPKPTLRRQRSLGDIALDFVHNHKRDGLKNQDLGALVRLCGKSPLFLPTDYSPFSLTIPTCFRALAQALVQHADTKGIFRVSGSARVVNSLYDYYCTNDNPDAVSSTTRCPTLPQHIRCNAHDIASTFKRFLAGLPGGILGSLSLFDALVAIYTQLQGDAESRRTKESKLRARLIALAIGTVRSQYRRELICAVFGLLCLIGRAAENAPREDRSGHPLPTTNLMGYSALGIIFGPLLIGDMIDEYSAKVANPSAGLVLLPVSPPRSRKERHGHKHEHRSTHRHVKKHSSRESPSFTMNKIHVANGITEMLIVHWREVVRQIRSTGCIKNRQNAPDRQYLEAVSNAISSSVLDSFPPRNLPLMGPYYPRSASPSVVSPTPRAESSTIKDEQDGPLGQRTPHARQTGISDSELMRKHSTKTSLHLLSPTIEESPSRIETLRSSQTDRHIVANTRRSRAYESGSEKDTQKSEVTWSKSTGDVGNTASAAIPSTEILKLKHQSSSKTLVKQHSVPAMPRSDMPSLDADPADNITAVKPTVNPSIRVHSPTPRSNSPEAHATSRLQHDVRASTNLEVPGQTTSVRTQVEMNPVNPSNVTIDEAGPRHAGASEETGLSGNHPPPPSEPASLHDGRHDGTPRSAYKQNQVAGPYARREGQSSPTSSPGRSFTPSRTQGKPDREDGVATGSPAGQRKAITVPSKGSTESLAKATKERRLKRSTGLMIPPRPSRDAMAPADPAPAPAPATPERKPRQQQQQQQQSVQWQRRSERKAAALATDSTKKKSPLSGTPSLTHLALANQTQSSPPGKHPHPTHHPRGGGDPRRSASKPAPGAVRAMAALFDSATLRKWESPGGGPAVSLTGRGRGRDRDSGSARGPNSPHRHRSSSSSSTGADESSPCPRPGRGGVPAPARRPPADSQPRPPARPSRDALRPALAFSAPRRAPPPPAPARRRGPESSGSSGGSGGNGGRPPRLGTMAPHVEEPAVGHFVRPGSMTTMTTTTTTTTSSSSAAAAAAAVATVSAVRSRSSPALLPFDGEEPRHVSGGGGGGGSSGNSGGGGGGRSSLSPLSSSSSLLHAQIRALGRRLEARDEEALRLRRRLEARAQADVVVGTLCEQLRRARRGCAGWRRRAEAAERRLAVFQRGSRDDGDDDCCGGGGEGEECGSGSGKGVAGECCLWDDDGDGDGDGDGESSCSVHTENPEAFQGRIRRCFARGAGPGDGDGGYGFAGDGEGEGGDEIRRDTSPGNTTGLWDDVREMLGLRDDDDDGVGV